MTANSIVNYLNNKGLHELAGLNANSDQIKYSYTSR